MLYSALSLYKLSARSLFEFDSISKDDFILKLMFSVDKIKSSDMSFVKNAFAYFIKSLSTLLSEIKNIMIVFSQIDLIFLFKVFIFLYSSSMIIISGVSALM